MLPIYEQHDAVFQFIHTSLIKAYLASTLFNSIVLETIAINANTQLSSGY